MDLVFESDECFLISVIFFFILKKKLLRLRKLFVRIKNLSVNIINGYIFFSFVISFKSVFVFFKKFLFKRLRLRIAEVMFFGSLEFVFFLEIFLFLLVSLFNLFFVLVLRRKYR